MDRMGDADVADFDADFSGAGTIVFVLCCP